MESNDIGSRSLQSFQEASKELDVFEGRQADLAGAASGYGSYCPEGIPIEQALCLLLAGFAIAFGILWTALTTTTGGRKRRALGPNDGPGLVEDFKEHSADVFWWGMFTIRAVH
jgi:hypothetical protein